MLGIRNFPYTSGRKLNWFTELKDVATDRLKEQIIINEGNCIFCNDDYFSVLKARESVRFWYLSLVCKYHFSFK